MYFTYYEHLPFLSTSTKREKFLSKDRSNIGWREGASQTLLKLSWGGGDEAPCRNPEQFIKENIKGPRFCLLKQPCENSECASLKPIWKVLWWRKRRIWATVLMVKGCWLLAKVWRREQSKENPWGETNSQSNIGGKPVVHSQLLGGQLRSSSVCKEHEGK